MQKIDGFVHAFIIIPISTQWQYDTLLYPKSTRTPQNYRDVRQIDFHIKIQDDNTRGITPRRIWQKLLQMIPSLSSGLYL